MSNYDEMAEAVNMLSGGENIVLLDDLGIPGVYVPINALKMSQLISGGSENLHPAFSVNDVNKKCFYYSKYQNVVRGTRAYSLAHKDPRASITFDTAKQYCDNKGTGWHLSTMAEWAAIALWCRKNGTMPHGNNNYGADIDNPQEVGQPSTIDSSTGKINRCFTGSGPSKWGHDWTKFGIQDMNGNVWEWQGGLRIVAGEIQIIPYNNAAAGSDADQSATSTLWKAIMPDGTLVAPGTAGTLHYDWISSKITLTNAADTHTTDDGQATPYNGIALGSGVSTAPEIAKALILYPDVPSGDYGGDYHWINCVGERMPRAGGSWDRTSYAGVFLLDLGNPRTDSGAYLGFRSAYIEL